MTVRNPIEWSGAQIVSAAHAASRFHDSLHHIQDTIHSPMPAVRRITNDDVWQSLRQGFADWAPKASVYTGISLTNNIFENERRMQQAVEQQQLPGH